MRKLLVFKCDSIFQPVSASTNPATVTATTTPTAAKEDDDDTSSNDTLTPAKDAKNGKTSCPKELSSKSQAVVQSVVRNDVKGTTEKIYSGKSSSLKICLASQE